MPAVGPFVLGHIIVVSKRHLPNLATMGEMALSEFDQLVGTVAQRPLFRGKSLLEAEHGSTETDRGGACIVHTHVNLIPTAGQHVSMFEGRLPLQAVPSQPGALIMAQAPYIWLRSGDTMFVHEATGVPSQLIRRELWARNERDDWDWGVFPQDELLRETVERW